MLFILAIIIILIIAIPILLVLIISRNTSKINASQSNSFTATSNETNGNTIKFCSNCGSEIHENAVVCVKCGCATSFPKHNKKDVQSVGLNILSFLFPLIGIILFFVFKDEKPIQANGAKKWALISFAINITLIILLLIIAIL